MEKEHYGSKAYFAMHPELSNELIDRLLGRGISIIGLDFAGLRRGREHRAKDQYCADRGVFVIENLYNLGQALNHKINAEFIAHTYPTNFEGLTGLSLHCTPYRNGRFYYFLNPFCFSNASTTAS